MRLCIIIIIIIIIMGLHKLLVSKKYNVSNYYCIIHSP